MTITVFQLLERLNREKPKNMKIPIGTIKEWVFEAMRKVESRAMFIEKTVVLEVKDGMVEIPKHAVYLKEVISEVAIMKKVDSMDYSIDNFASYYINGRYLYTNLPDGTKLELIIHSMPVDNMNNPLIKDDEYLIKAIISYILHMEARKMWMSDIFSERKYREYEREWLFYVRSAQSSLERPNKDTLRGLTFLQTPVSTWRDEVSVVRRNKRPSSDSPRVIEADK